MRSSRSDHLKRPCRSGAVARLQNLDLSVVIVRNSERAANEMSGGRTMRRPENVPLGGRTRRRDRQRSRRDQLKSR